MRPWASGCPGMEYTAVTLAAPNDASRLRTAATVEQLSIRRSSALQREEASHGTACVVGCTHTRICLVISLPYYTYVYMYIYIHLCNTQIYVYIYIYTFICIYICVFIYTFIYTYACTHKCFCFRVGLRTSIHAALCAGTES